MKTGISLIMLPLICLAALVACAARNEEPTTRVDVTSQPSGAKVLIDHRERGVTPLILTDLPPGAHLLQLSQEGYCDLFETITLETGVPLPLNLRLDTQTGILLMITDPSGCDVSVKGVSLGATPLLVTSLASGAHRLTISSPGYQTKEIDVELDGRTPLKQEVALLSDSGTLEVSADPEGAEVLVNGISRGEAPCRIDRIPGGIVTLQLQAPGFIAQQREITLAAGEVQNINIQLKPLPGTLRIVAVTTSATPLEGARVYIDNEFKGDTPFDFVNAAPKLYRVRIDKTGYESVAREVTLEKGASVTEECRLAKITGRLEIVTAPASATILIDGKKIGITSTRSSDSNAVSDPFATDEINEGEHEIEIFRKGFATQKRKIEVKRGETLTLQFKLVRQFIPNYEVTTARMNYKGVLEFMNEEGIRIEVSPGISQTIPMKDVKKHGPLQIEE